METHTRTTLHATIGRWYSTDRAGRAASAGSAHAHLHLVLRAVVHQRDLPRIEPASVERDFGLTGTRVHLLDGDVVRAPPESVLDAVAGPAARHARPHGEHVGALGEAEKCLHADAVEPARGPRVPGPPAAAELPVGRVHVRRHGVGLDAIYVDLVAVSGVGERIDHLEQLERAVAV